MCVPCVCVCVEVPSLGGAVGSEAKGQQSGENCLCPVQKNEISNIKNMLVGACNMNRETSSLYNNLSDLRTCCWLATT